MGLFSWLKGPKELEEFKEKEKKIKRLKLEVGKLGAFLAINMEKGRLPLPEAKQAYQEAVNQLVLELESYLVSLRQKREMMVELANDTQIINQKIRDLEDEQKKLRQTEII